jgi:Ca2+-binding EF-hand superfamily protein
MARFTRKFLKNQEVIPLGQISSTVDKIWVKYDLDRSGFLNRRETLKFLNDFLVTKGQPPATIAKFNQFFREIDLNSDGYVSRSEMAQFIKGYLTAPQVTDPVTELTNKIFAKYDFNRNGFLDKRECL